MLPTLVDQAPDGNDWLHEIKYDGYRTEISIDGADTRAFTRNGYDWTGRYIHVVESALALRCGSALIDGEICVQTATGLTDFKALRSAIQLAPERLVFFAFDLLMIDGRVLHGEPLVDRRSRLRDLLGTEPSSRIIFSADHLGEGPAFFKAADQHGLEGIVSKRADSLYAGGRTRAWVKTKSYTVGDFAVLGVERSATGLPIALLATLGGNPAYVGNATVTLPDKERKSFWSSVERMGTPRARLAGLAGNRTATWIKEGLVARVRHLRGEEKLRHATLQSLDLAPVGPDEDAPGRLKAR